MLTAKQEQFAQNIVEGMTQVEAYRSAYDTKNMSEKTAYEKASVLAGQDKVRARVAVISTEKIISAQKRLEWLTEAIYSEEVSVSDKLRAIDLMNKMQGVYVQKLEADVKSVVNITVELTD